jgi:hypothetical protein
MIKRSMIILILIEKICIFKLLLVISLTYKYTQFSSTLCILRGSSKRNRNHFLGIYPFRSRFKKVYWNL